MKKFLRFSILAGLISSVLTVASASAEDGTSWDGVSQTDDNGALIEEADSVGADVMPLAEERAGQSFFDGVIPPSPQASALARYALYPVSHTTGIPDITVPLYEIDLGGYRLPISISYHASGARPDQIPSCIGLGWTLNAGGAVSRTVIGKPDMYVASASYTDYSYYDRDTFVRLLESVDAGDGKIDPGHLWAIIGDSPEWDTESDRYTFNVGGKTGVFRYSHLDRRYIVLNNSNDVVTSYGKHGQGTSFWIRSTDGTSYDFTREEATGVIDGFNEKPFTSTWYVTSIATPYGEITFSYEHGIPVDVRHQSLTATSGPVRELTEHFDAKGQSEYAMTERYLLEQSSTDYTFSYGQEVLTGIEWNGNRIEFEYVDEHPYRTLRRLTHMRVYGADGALRKTVSFGNTDNWPTDDSRTGRRLLSTVTDSENGTWRFEYNKGVRLPALSEAMGCSASRTDLWGYLNATTPSADGDVFTAGQIRWQGGRGRLPELEFPLYRG